MNFVWAVDPYESDLCPAPEVIAQLKALAGNSLKGAAPVFICGMDAGNQTEVQRKLEEYLGTFVKESTGKPEILYTGSPSKKDWIAALLAFAKEKKAEMIVLTSHGRTGLSRLVLGSFAESLLEQAQVPVLFLRKAPLTGENPKKAAFATDFSEGSKKAFEKFLSSFSQQISEVTLFHAVSFPEGALGVAGTAGVPISYPDFYIKEQAAWAQKESKVWMENAGQLGIPCQVHSLVDESVVMNPSAAIEKFLETQHIGFLGMASPSGTVSKFLLGSVAQNLVTTRKFSIWVCGPKF